LTIKQGYAQESLMPLNKKNWPNTMGNRAKTEKDQSDLIKAEDAHFNAQVEYIRSLEKKVPTMTNSPLPQANSFALSEEDFDRIQLVDSLYINTQMVMQCGDGMTKVAFGEARDTQSLGEIRSVVVMPAMSFLIMSDYFAKVAADLRNTIAANNALTSPSGESQTRRMN
jgi:hypothetical protein